MPILTKITCNNLNLGFYTFDPFRIIFPEKINFPFWVRIFSDYENYILIEPTKFLILPGVEETNQFYVGIKKNYNLKRVKLRIQVIGDRADEFQKHQVTIPIIDPINKMIEINENTQKKYKCLPRLIISFSEIFMTDVQKQFTIQIGYSSRVVD